MTQDEAFLQAITEAPGDDTTRLIYADWLEEQHQQDRATFLRLECSLLEAVGDEKQYADLEARLNALRATIDSSWVSRAGKLYDVILEWYSPLAKILTIKNVRMATGLNLKEAVDLVHRAPCVLRRGIPWDQAIEMKKTLQDCGPSRLRLREPNHVRVIISKDQAIP